MTMCNQMKTNYFYGQHQVKLKHAQNVGTTCTKCWLVLT